MRGLPAGEAVSHLVNERLELSLGGFVDCQGKAKVGAWEFFKMTRHNFTDDCWLSIRAPNRSY
jgi:hypothetical protein